MAQQIDLDAANNRTKIGVPMQGNASPVLFKHLEKDVAGSADITLTSSEYDALFHTLTGTLTGDIDYIVPNTEGSLYIIFNLTDGSFDVTVIGASGTGVVVAQDGCAILMGDGTNIRRVTTDAGSGGPPP